MSNSFQPGYRVKVLNEDPTITAAFALIPEAGTIGIVSPVAAPDGKIAVRFRADRLGITVPANPTVQQRTVTLFLDPSVLFAVPRYIDERGHQAHPLGTKKAIASYEFPTRFDTVIRDAERGKQWGMTLGFEHTTCYHCGARYTYRAEGDALVSTTECTEIGGLKPYRLLLNVPSGEIVFANDLRDLVVAEDPLGTDVNSLVGQREESRAFERAGMLFVSVGNTCPSVYREGDGTFALANRYTPEDDDTLSDEDLERMEADLAAKREGSICTDLWWVSAMDRALFAERCAQEGVDLEDEERFIVKVEPGVYAFDVNPSARGEGGDEIIYARFFRVDEAPPQITDGTEPPAACLAESYLWRRMQASFAAHGRYYGHDPVRYLESKFMRSGSTFVQGHLRDRSRQPDASFWRSNHPDGRGGTFKTYRPSLIDLSSVPTFVRMATVMGGDSWDYPPTLADAPLDIDPYWLAAGLMFTKTAIERPECFYRRQNGYRSPKVSITMKTLAVLGEIAQRRGLLHSDELARIFEEIAAAV